jgi:peroxiredoxin
MIKSIFITLYVAFLFVAISLNIQGFSANEGDVYWFAAIVCPAIPLAYFGFIFIRRPFSVGAWRMVASPLIFASWMISLGQFIFEHEEMILPVITSGIVTLGWLAYDLWYAKFKRKEKQELEGSVLADMSFADLDGNAIDVATESSAFKVYLFHRGNWCPFCIGQASEMSDSAEELESYDASINFVSTQSALKNKWLHARSNSKFRFLTDSGNQVGRRLKIEDRFGLPLGFQILGFKSEVAKPTILITDNGNKVLRAFTAKDYRSRPWPEMIIRTLKKYA